MALTKTTTSDRIEVVGDFKHIHIRDATVIKDDGVEISRSFHRKTLVPGTLDASDNLVDTDLSGEDADVKAIAEAAWTTQVKADYKAFLIANKPS